MIFSRARLSIIALSLAFGWTAFAAETNQILFLRVKLKDGAVTLVESQTRPGVLKKARGAETKRPLIFTLKSADEATLWESSMDDPLVRRMEEGDPVTGEIKAVVAELNEAEFTIRVPVTRSMNHVAFYREEKAVTAAASAGTPPKTERKLIGKVAAPEPK